MNDFQFKKKSGIQGCHGMRDRLEAAHLSGDKLPDRLLHCNLAFLALEGSKITDVYFDDCNFSHAELHGAKFSGSSINCSCFLSANLRDTAWTSWGNERVSIVDCWFVSGEYGKTSLKGAGFNEVEFRNCRFHGVDMNGITLDDVCFANCVMRDCDLDAYSIHINGDNDQTRKVVKQLLRCLKRGFEEIEADLAKPDAGGDELKRLNEEKVRTGLLVNAFCQRFSALVDEDMKRIRTRCHSNPLDAAAGA